MIFFSKTFNELTTDELYELLKARFQIFVLEQKIMYQDMDDIDRQCLHCFFKDGDKIVACIRACYTDESKTEVKISRVLTLSHGNGLGKQLMGETIRAIKEKLPYERLIVHSQKQAVGYYKKMGFVEISDEFIQSGIPHIKMQYIE